MMEYIDSVAHRLRFIIVGLLILSSLAFLVVLLSTPVLAQRSDPETAEMTSSMYAGPNAVTNSLGIMAHQIGSSADATVDAFAGIGSGMSKGLSSVGDGFAAVGSGFASAGRWGATTIGKSASFVANAAKTGASAFGQGVGTGAAVAGRGIYGGLKTTVTVTSSVVGLVSNTPVVSAAVTSEDIVEAPNSDTKQPVTIASIQESNNRQQLPLAETIAQEQSVPAPPKVDDTPVWPISGNVTTFFGVPHWPYQPTHTGMDISDGRISGMTAIKPFRPGKVIQTIPSFSGLGHHVIIDHGDGLTSVYAHMASIAVNPGQDVDKNTVLGTEGSTGASTGTHLHFEIRVNGTPVNPMDYVSGRP